MLAISRNGPGKMGYWQAKEIVEWIEIATSMARENLLETAPDYEVEAAREATHDAEQQQ